ncbi:MULTISPECIES: LysR family transcriptional regulator [unclassified Chelatococcus]|uniref:LysR family transcriptional regulator n=1 Tax=unclassified Chelatococcus TaxID=2638111 RepID=UPI001BCFB45B|nr:MULTISPECIES: LysR family transcriptional regulator [unclassified Chelatococcus]MBS7700275.1 LysR family transcriptional regulator [Chelatococcus sp. YT9]MBX3558246.1 LysR family transcriptional regulator [Chelatococcus sp.]
MNLAQLRAFNAVANHRTFSAAAQALGVSQSAITQHVKSLEDSVGARLFLRMAGGVELTADARDLLPKVRQAILMLDDISARMSDGRSLATGHLAIGLCAPYVAMPMLERFTAEHPGIQLEVRLENSSSLLELVAQHRVDIAIATLRAPHPDFACDFVVDQRVEILVHADHPWWNRRRVETWELVGQRLVTREAGSMTRHLFEEAMAARNIELPPHLILGSREAVKEAVAAGIGIGIVLDQERGLDPRLRSITVSDLDISAGEYIVTRRETRGLGSVAAFLAIANEIAKFKTGQVCGP